MPAQRVAATDLLPRWTKRAATELSGRDPLGLSRVAQMLADGLLPGIITQTDRARYYALYCWILWHIEREDEPSSWQAFVESFQRREAAVALANIVGYYADAAGTEHGFLDAGGTFSPIDFPGAIHTVAYGINATGDIVGYYIDAASIPHGFLATDSHTGAGAFEYGPAGQPASQ